MASLIPILEWQLALGFLITWVERWSLGECVCGAAQESFSLTELAIHVLIVFRSDVATA